MVSEDGCLFYPEVSAHYSVIPGVPIGIDMCGKLSGAVNGAHLLIPAISQIAYCLQGGPEADVQDDTDTESLTSLARDANFQAFVLQSCLLYLCSCKGQLPLLAIIAGIHPASG